MRSPRAGSVATVLAPLIRRLLPSTAPIRLEFWDGSALQPRAWDATIRLRSPDALHRLVTAPGELGLGRAYVAGDLDLDGDFDTILSLGTDRGYAIRMGPPEVALALRALGQVGALPPRRLPPPPEEVRLRGPRHSRQRDAAAIAHHYDISNDFYRLVLGSTMNYSCAYFATPSSSLDTAQTDKMELICRKLRLQPGERVMDIGCGWGSLAIHAATMHGVSVVGVTLSAKQAELGAKRVAEAGVADRVTIRLQDERDVDDGPFDAITSVGMFEHVGESRMGRYFGHLFELLRPQGRLLNHGIARPPGQPAAFDPQGFADRYVFPDGELLEVGRVVSVMQEAGFEVRDVENLREHYALTLRRWVANLEAHRDEAVRLVGEGRYRVWRLYMAVASRTFDTGQQQIHQVLGVKADGGRSGLPLRRGDTMLA